MLDDDNGVALVDQPIEHEQEFADVFEVQTGRRLIEHVHAAAHGAPLQLSGKFHPLRLPAGEGGGTLPQPNVAQPDVDERLQITVDRGDRLEELRRLRDRHVEHLGDVLPLVQHREGVPVVPGATAHLAGDVDIREEVHFDLDGAVA